MSSSAQSAQSANIAQSAQSALKLLKVLKVLKVLKKLKVLQVLQVLQVFKMLSVLSVLSVLKVLKVLNAQSAQSHVSSSLWSNVSMVASVLDCSLYGKSKSDWLTDWMSEWQGHPLSCSGQLKIQHYRPINHLGMAIWSFDLFYNVKTAEIGAKIFKINKMAKNHFSKSDLGS